MDRNEHWRTRRPAAEVRIERTAETGPEVDKNETTCAPSVHTAHKSHFRSGESHNDVTMSALWLTQWQRVHVLRGSGEASVSGKDGMGYNNGY